MSNVVEARIKAVAGSFSEFDDDIDEDGAACEKDRELMVALQGAHIGQPHDPPYKVHADFDLDGAIDASDLEAFDDLYPQLPHWKCD